MAITGAAALSESIALTHDILKERATQYRNLVVCVVVVTLGSAGVALTLDTWQPLVGIGLLWPLCGFFFWRDAKLTLRWQRQVLQPWIEGTLDLQLLHRALTANPALPPRTLEGMFGLLPIPLDPAPARLWSRPTRQALADLASAVLLMQSDRLAVRSLGWAIAIAVPALALLSGLPSLLTGWLLLVVVPVLSRRLAEMRWRAFQALVVSLADDLYQHFMEVALHQVTWEAQSLAYRNQLIRRVAG